MVVVVVDVAVAVVVAGGGLVGVGVEGVRLKMTALMADTGAGRGLMMEERRSSWC